MWIKVEDELPIQGIHVRAKNGKRTFDAKYYRKKWYSYHDWDVWEDGEAREVRLHKVTEWWKCPVMYPKISPRAFIAFYRRAQKYKHQMQKKR